MATTQQERVLRCMLGGVTRGQDIAMEIGVSRQRVHSIRKQLERDGLVEQHKHGVWSVTPEGASSVE